MLLVPIPAIAPAMQPNLAGDLRWPLLRCAPLLREDPENELPLLMGFKGGGDDDILSWRQEETFRYLPQVNVAFAFSGRGCIQEEVFLEMLSLSAHLRQKEIKFINSLGMLVTS